MTDERKYEGIQVLYVDDEEQSLKYFTMAMKRVVEVVTATSGAEALEHLERQGERIAVLITDQRMPGLSGVELLRRVRAEFPHVVRLLTTAFAELDHAIEAVNSGAIFAYVTKPWKLPELGSTIKQALEYSRMQHERDALLREKLAILRQRAGVERLRLVSILSAAFGHRLQHADTAAIEFCEHARLLDSSDAPTRLENLWDTMWVETGRARDIAVAVNHVLDSDEGMAQAVDTAECWAAAAAREGVELRIKGAAQVPTVRADANALCAAFCGVLQALSASTRGGFTVDAERRQDVRGTPGIRWTFAASGTDPAALQSAYRGQQGLLSPLLKTYFLVCHAAGAVRALGDARLALDLPLDPAESQFVPQGESSLEALFQRLEGF